MIVFHLQANVAMAYLDEVFSASSLHHIWNKKKCCIVTMASLKLAIKLFEPRMMSMDAMLMLGKRMGISYSFNSVVDMEHQIMLHLSWDMFPPTAFCFVYHMICLFPQEVRTTSTGYIVQELAKYMTELTACECPDSLNFNVSLIAKLMCVHLIFLVKSVEYTFVKFKLSSTSFASCLIAMDW
jgi:hypothetical protein